MDGLASLINQPPAKEPTMGTDTKSFFMQRAAILRPFTIWRFRSVDGKQEVVVAKHSEPHENQNEYCTVLRRVMAHNHKEALTAPAGLGG